MATITRGRDYAQDWNHEGAHDAGDLDPTELRTLVENRVTRLMEQRGPAEAVEGVLEGTPGVPSTPPEALLEKLSGEKNLLPASFLSKGATRARAVCRIAVTTAQGRAFGTGFLVAPDVIMTNNHVLPTADSAGVAVAEFFYEDGQASRRVALDPDRLFYTHVDLDFSLVRLQAGLVDEIRPIPLLRDPYTVGPHERVNIIQHPSGRTKEVALQDNVVKEVRSTVVRYETDTEPGSSGSPVFNNEWELVALHHAGWMEQKFDDRGRQLATNEGIRICAIVRHLTSARRTPREAVMLEAVAENVAGSPPGLGFFGLAGLVRTEADVARLEREVPDFQGTPGFADLGFWNIEHFNDDVDDARIDGVARVLAGLNLDVIGLSEVEQGALDRLVPALAGRGMSVGTVYLDAWGTQDLAVLYDRSTSRVERWDGLDAEHRALLDDRTPEGTAFPRHPLFALCTVGEGATAARFMMIVVHLKAMSGQANVNRRRRAAEHLARLVRFVEERVGVPVVLGGDFNETLATGVLAPLTDSTLRTLTTDDARGGAMSYIGGRYRSLIDHVIVSADARVAGAGLDDAFIVRFDQAVPTFDDQVSDHVPVVTRLVYRDGPPAPPAALRRDEEPPGVAIPAGATSLSFHFG